LKQDTDISTLRLAVLASEMTFAQAVAKLERSEQRACLRLKELRKQVGQQIFRKQGERFRPTRAGRVLIAYARRILALNDEMLSRLRTGAYTYDALWLRLNANTKQWLPRMRTAEAMNQTYDPKGVFVPSRSHVQSGVGNSRRIQEIRPVQQIVQL
jgi:hypothetical protein